MKAVAEVTLAAAEDTGARSSIKPEQAHRVDPGRGLGEGQGPGVRPPRPAQDRQGEHPVRRGRSATSPPAGWPSPRPTSGSSSEPPAHRSERRRPRLAPGPSCVPGSVEGPTSSVPEPSPQAPWPPERRGRGDQGERGLRLDGLAGDDVGDLQDQGVLARAEVVAEIDVDDGAREIEDESGRHSRLFRNGHRLVRGLRDVDRGAVLGLDRDRPLQAQLLRRRVDRRVVETRHVGEPVGLLELVVAPDDELPRGEDEGLVPLGALEGNVVVGEEELGDAELGRKGRDVHASGGPRPSPRRRRRGGPRRPRSRRARPEGRSRRRSRPWTSGGRRPPRGGPRPCRPCP